MCSKSAKAGKGVNMNRIDNYGMTNYQTNFQARNAKKPIKTLADVIKKQKPLSQNEQKFNSIYNLVKIMKCECNCNGDAFMNEGLSPIERSDNLKSLLNIKY